MEQFFEYIKMAVGNIWANKGRSFLTMLGIIIGITSVVTIVSIGNGLKADVMDAANTQSNTVVVQTNAEEVMDTEIITNEDISFLKTSMEEDVKSVYASGMASGKTSTRKGTFDAYVTFATPDYENAQYMDPMTKGNYFTDNDIANRSSVCVISELTALYLFGNTDVLGMTLELNIDNNIQMLSIIGIRETTQEMMEAEKQYQAMGMPESITIEMPYTISADFGDPIDGFSSVSLSVYDKEDAQRTARTAVQVLTSRHQGLGETPFIQQKAMDLTDMFGPIMDGVTAFIAMVAAISLVVGGIGVMNIMLVSVTERTREIGIRKALGAKTGSIITQFLCESVIISGLGGAIGILLGAGLTSLISLLEIGGIKAHLSLPAVIVATIFSCGVGIVFGIYPARKAASLSPIEALRRQ